MRILFLTDLHLYLYNRLLSTISDDFRKEGHETAIIFRENNIKYKQLQVDLKPNFNSTFYFGQDHFGMARKGGESKISSFIKFFRATKKVKREILEIVNSFQPDIIITPSSYDIASKILVNSGLKYNIFYLQHSNIINNKKRLSKKQRLENIIYKGLLGFPLTTSSTRPPFGSKKLIYLIWSEIWANNVHKNEFNIQYVPKILSQPSKPPRSNNGKIQNILINK